MVAVRVETVSTRLLVSVEALAGTVIDTFRLSYELMVAAAPPMVTPRLVVALEMELKGRWVPMMSIC